MCLFKDELKRAATSTSDREKERERERAGKRGLCGVWRTERVSDCNTLQYTAIRCNTLQRTATRCNVEMCGVQR